MDFLIPIHETTNRYNVIEANDIDDKYLLLINYINTTFVKFTSNYRLKFFISGGPDNTVISGKIVVKTIPFLVGVFIEIYFIAKLILDFLKGNVFDFTGIIFISTIIFAFVIEYIVFKSECNRFFKYVI